MTENKLGSGKRTQEPTRVTPYSSHLRGCGGCGCLGKKEREVPEHASGAASLTCTDTLESLGSGWQGGDDSRHSESSWPLEVWLCGTVFTAFVADVGPGHRWRRFGPVPG